MDDPSGNMKELSNTIKVSLLNLTNSSRKQIYFPFNKMGNRNHQRRRQNVRYYYLRPGDFTERERRLIHLTIHDPRGWITTHSAVEHTLNKANSDIRIHKVSRREMRKRFPQVPSDLADEREHGLLVYVNRTRQEVAHILDNTDYL